MGSLSLHLKLCTFSDNFLNRFELFEPILFKPFQSFKSFKPSESMTGDSFKPMPDLYPVAEGIIAIDRMAALFMPGDFRGIRPPVVFFAVEPLKNRRVQFRCDAKIDMRSFDRPRAALGNLIHSMQNHQLSRVRYSKRYLFITRHLSFFRQAERIPIPGLSLFQIRHFDSHMADASERDDLPLGFVSYRITADRKLHRVAVGIENKERLFDRTRRRVFYRAMPS